MHLRLTIRRFVLILVGLAIVLVAAIPFMQIALWSGRHTLTVIVQAFDSDELVPIPDAKVTIFEGPMTPIEPPISWLHPSDFEPDEKSPKTKSTVTDAAGKCEFSYVFRAGGADGPLEHSGYVITEQTWIRVLAPGRPTAFVPVDRQSLPRSVRDIKDATPIFVTVVMNKKVSDVPR